MNFREMVDTATRLRLSRRGALKLMGAGATYTAGFATHLAVSEAIVRGVEGMAEKPARAFHATDLDEADFKRMADSVQRAAFEAWKARRLNDIPDAIRGRGTIAVRRDGEMWVTWQGEATAMALWRGRPPIGPMSQQPDRAFGAWRGEALATCADLRRPVFQLVRSVVEGADGKAVAHRFTALLLPDGETVGSFSHDLPRTAPRPLPPDPPRSRQVAV